MSLAQGIDILSKQAAWLKECFPHPHGPRGAKEPGRVCVSGGWVPGGTFLGRVIVPVPPFRRMVQCTPTALFSLSGSDTNNLGLSSNMGA